MLSGWVLSALAVGYLAFLFAIAFYGDRRAIYPSRQRLRPYIYGLALGVYCTSWTFYGAVGTAFREGWGYLPIYVGPILVFLLALPFLERLVETGRAHKVASIGDFIGSRFGKSRSLAVLITLIAVTAVTPYLALQYKAVAASIAALTIAAPGAVPWHHDIALAVALLMALFAVLFGARKVDATEHHEGLMLAIAFESLLKIAAFVAVALYAWMRLRGHALHLPSGLTDSATLINTNTIAATLLAAAAIFCLPRQFQVTVIECVDSGDLRRAGWILPLYLGIFSVLVVPIVALASSGSHALYGGADTLVLTLPLAEGARWLALLVFLGGLSASTAMVVVSSIALSTMISNDIAVPLLWHSRLEAGASLARRILWLRRTVIVGIALLAFGYYRVTSGSTSLASIGMLSFAAIAQFAPGLLAALYWRGASRAGVFWGMLAGFLVWGYLLFLPNLVAGGVLSGGGLVPHQALAWLWPRAAVYYSSRGVFGPIALAALGLNALILITASLLRGVSDQERRAARVFAASKRATISAKVADLEAVTARIIGPVAARRSLAEYDAQMGRPESKGSDAVDRGMLQHVERVLGASIGASSARIVLTHALRRKGLDADEVAELLDETSQELRFSRQLLAATLENVTQGISVVDAQMHLVAWNRRCLELFDYPGELVTVGRPVADLIRWNAQRGEFGAGDPEFHVAKRLAHLRAGTAYTYQRERGNGQVLSISGQPMAGGGYLTTYTDITDFKRTEQALRDAKQKLEERVEQRTRELSEALEAQRSAKQQAEAANIGKTRFVAAASHDLLQPLNAARLFVSALETRAHALPEIAEITGRIDASMRAAEELLKDLLDVAQLDIGGMRPDVTTFSISELLEDLRRQYAPLAQSRRLRLTVVGCEETVRSDRVLLRRILQNYVSNGLRYCKRGGILIGCRRRGSELEICVYDTGPGIAAHQREHLYLEFTRLEQGSPWGEKGLGLGLSICDRLARLLEHELTLRSQPGRGSVFGVCVPRVAQATRPARQRSRSAPAEPIALSAFRVLVVDNDLAILDAMQALLEQWGVRVLKAPGTSEALRLLSCETIDAVLADYHLGDGSNGLELLQRVAEIQGRAMAALITADHTAELTRAARRAGVPLLHKPVRPAALRALLGGFQLRVARSSAA
jgi:Na+/proline symporter/signal transduction histidine kinase